MPSLANTPSKPNAAPAKAAPPSLDAELEALAQRVLAYAVQAKVRHFRYSRRPHRSSATPSELRQSIQILDEKVRAAARNPVCQTHAVELLRELAAISQYQAAAQLIHSALLELR